MGEYKNNFTLYVDGVSHGGLARISKIKNKLYGTGKTVLNQVNFFSSAISKQMSVILYFYSG